jgi:hypothetical protein
LLLNPTKASVNEGLKQTASQQVGQKWGRSKQQKSVDKKSVASSLANLCGRAEAGFLAHLSNAVPHLPILCCTVLKSLSLAFL